MKSEVDSLESEFEKRRRHFRSNKNCHMNLIPARMPILIALRQKEERVLTKFFPLWVRVGFHESTWASLNPKHNTLIESEEDLYLFGLFGLFIQRSSWAKRKFHGLVGYLKSLRKFRNQQYILRFSNCRLRIKRSQILFESCKLQKL